MENYMSADKTISQQIDAIIKELGDWRSETLSQLRALINQADPALIEEVKWKKPSKPSGIPVWSQLKSAALAASLFNPLRYFVTTPTESPLLFLSNVSVGAYSDQA